MRSIAAGRSTRADPCSCGALGPQGPCSLAWRLSNTLTAEFCVEALKDVIARYAVPAIFSTDQGSQFTGDDFMFLFLQLGFLDFETANVLWLGEGGEFGAPQRHS